MSAEELGGAAVHCKISGVTDHFAANDAHALQLARTVVKNLHLAGRNVQALAALDDTPVEEPLYAADELRGLIPANTAKPFDIRTVIARVVDGSKLDEFKPLYGSTLVTGFARLYGQPIGIVANNGILCDDPLVFRRFSHPYHILRQNNRGKIVYAPSVYAALVARLVSWHFFFLVCSSPHSPLIVYV